MADADAALARLGTATVMGRGLGAYVALLLAGARPTEVRGAILRDGPGLVGGGPRPGTAVISTVDPDAVVPPDPFAAVELSRDVRPPDYASSFARQAAQLSALVRPIAVCAIGRPEWLRAVLEEPGVEESEPGEALAAYGVIEAG
jgi:pimeloyl-ACP methyl ester carboxylesterase